MIDFASTSPVEAWIDCYRVPRGHVGPEHAHKTGVSAANISDPDNPDFLPLDGSVDKTPVVAELPRSLAAIRASPETVIPGLAAPYEFVVQLGDSPETAQGKRQAAFGHGLAEVILTGVTGTPREISRTTLSDAGSTSPNRCESPSETRTSPVSPWSSHISFMRSATKGHAWLKVS